MVLFSFQADKDRLDSILTFHMLRKGLDVTQMVTVNASNPLGLTEVKFGIVGNGRYHYRMASHGLNPLMLESSYRNCCLDF